MSQSPEFLRKVMILDGSMGAFLQSRGLPPGKAPDLWNLERPDVVEDAHGLYVSAGANIILTNTFGATGPRLETGDTSVAVADVNRAAVQRARNAAATATGTPPLVAGDVGPLGLTVQPSGELPFADAVRYFSEQIRVFVEEGVDLLVLETFIDIVELRAAIIAANDCRGEIPLVACMSFGVDAVTDTGVTPEALAVVAEGLRVDAVGVNCSTGPEPMLAVVQRLCAATALPVAVQPNAGLPLRRDGELVFPMTPEEMSPWYERFVAAGANLVGGCCGTTPDTIRLAAGAVGGRDVAERGAGVSSDTVRIASRAKVASFGPGQPFVVIGERINPTGKPKFAKALQGGSMDRVLGAARAQAKAGATALDVNVGVPGIDEPAVMAQTVAAVQNAVDLPLVLDSSDPAALESGLQAYAGRALVNSVSLEEGSLEQLALIRRYGAVALLLPTGDGIPEDVAGRMENLQGLLAQAEQAGLPRGAVIGDTLALTASAMQAGAIASLGAAFTYRCDPQIPSLCGLSNISFGLPRRKLVNRTYLAMALANGLDGAICDPLDTELMDTLAAAAIFCGRDLGCTGFLDRFAGAPPLPPTKAPRGAPRPPLLERLAEAVAGGDRTTAPKLARKALEEGHAPLALLLETLTPAIRLLGEQFARRERFIPHLVAGAEAMQKAVEVLQPHLLDEGRPAKGTVVFGTVDGDVHDIGKNICVLMLRSFGYQVVDLGRSVKVERFVAAAKEHDADLVAMSALMTTTMGQMRVVIEALREAGLGAKTMVGGAVLTAGAAKEIGADAYGRDAAAVVDVADELMGG